MNASPAIVARLPVKWPGPPDWMTFSTLIEIEDCPLRWSLANADYPELWHGKGYPRRIGYRQAFGIVVHASIARVIALLNDCGCDSMSDGRAVAAMKSVGGFRAIIIEEISRATSNIEHNPRQSVNHERLLERLEREYGRLRETIQHILSRTYLVGSSHQGQMTRQRIGSGGEITCGSFAELALRHPRQKWRGRLDLIHISDASVEIVEHKAGMASEDHELQMHVYEWLWLHDAELNPKMRPANRLIVSYAHNDSEVKPYRGQDAREFELQIVERTSEVLSQVAGSDPPAATDPERCRTCQVRQLCSAYWNSCIPHATYRYGTNSQHFIDVEIVLETQRSKGVWTARCTSVIRHESLEFQNCVLQNVNIVEVRSGMRLRVLHGHFATWDDDLGSCLVNVRGESEAFIVP